MRSGGGGGGNMKRRGREGGGGRERSRRGDRRRISGFIGVSWLMLSHFPPEARSQTDRTPPTRSCAKPEGGSLLPPPLPLAHGCPLDSFPLTPAFLHFSCVALRLTSAPTCLSSQRSWLPHLQPPTPSIFPPLPSLHGRGVDFTNRGGGGS